MYLDANNSCTMIIFYTNNFYTIKSDERIYVLFEIKQNLYVQADLCLSYSQLSSAHYFLQYKQRTCSNSGRDRITSTSRQRDIFPFLVSCMMDSLIFDNVCRSLKGYCIVYLVFMHADLFRKTW